MKCKLSFSDLDFILIRNMIYILYLLSGGVNMGVGLCIFIFCAVIIFLLFL